MISNVYNIDCMEAMREMKDNQFELAIVDPEYGKDAANMTMGKGLNKQWIKKDWDKKTPDNDYFNQLFRVSKRQIIWGGNYFDLPKTGGWLLWDKDRQKDISFADGELAWTSFLKNLKILKVKYDGFLGADTERIHPTQKPISLYKWLLRKYGQQGDHILDTHMGSQSSRIACHDMGFDFTGYEIDKEYFDQGNKRYEEHIKQGSLFNAQEMY